MTYSIGFPVFMSHISNKGVLSYFQKKNIQVRCLMCGMETIPQILGIACIITY